MPTIKDLKFLTELYLFNTPVMHSKSEFIRGIISCDLGDPNEWLRNSNISDWLRFRYFQHIIN